MGDCRVAVEYLSAGANRHTAVADWSPDGLVAFGAGSNVALWRPHGSRPRGITSLLSGHKDVVKAVSFLPALDGESRTYLLTGADDQCLRIWVLPADRRLDPDPSSGSGAVACIQTVQAHAAPINCIAILREGRLQGTALRLFATGAADASIKLWAFDGNQARLLQTIQTSPKYFPLSIALSRLARDEEEEVLVLAAAGTRNTIQVFVAGPGTNTEFQHEATLSGHEGWVRSLDFAREDDAPGSDLILASASQDRYIRLWRFHQGKDLPAPAAGTDPSMGAFLPGKSPSNKAHRLKVAEKQYSITFEALLLGHDDWIYSAKWYSDPPNGILQLLSTSADNTLAIWEADRTSGIWVTTVRLGEISREKGATTATGSTGGFWTGLWSPDGSSVACLGRTGSWRWWSHSREPTQWIPRVGISGHTKAVTGIAWSQKGDYLLSTSTDQTTRLHASWSRGAGQRTWHEMARPQIHGYDLNSIDSLGDTRFVSGADEKLMRVFDEPKAVARLLGSLCDIDSDHIEAMPDAANMPVLGLSNKAVDAVNDDQEGGRGEDQIRAAGPDPDPDRMVRRSVLEIDHPPLEDSLSRHTLWPEIEKLYGHGYEISCLAVSHDGTLIASACKASSVNHAVIRLFETERWTEVKPPLTAHSLTATRLRFSPDDRHLLSVGRDRQWAVFERDDGGTPGSYGLLQSNLKGHSRMILDAAWSPRAADSDSLVFATAGRDKQVKIWRREGSPSPNSTDTTGGSISCATTIPETHPVTAVDFLNSIAAGGGTMVLAVGTEVGKISIYTLDETSLGVRSALHLTPELWPAKAVLQLAWRPRRRRRELAIAAEDGSLRVYAFLEENSNP
ncbi:RNA polymerase II Elongator subunit [Durotheca rogersii]|uniref:RNA polymerase II Elongator subunit n=1 Tax=Durotheca rogersii TaxID=419775 RepID=UPI002220BF6C|nr:RNA polymerase II Elongator subunit [Durotheca rogersii]KAI5862756.1 RNA polymerase II Elongator subunit [Durotheca rogersii]